LKQGGKYLLAIQNNEESITPIIHSISYTKVLGTIFSELEDLILFNDRQHGKAIIMNKINDMSGEEIQLPVNEQFVLIDFLESMVYLAVAKSGKIFIIEKNGRIRDFTNLLIDEAYSVAHATLSNNKRHLSLVTIGQKGKNWGMNSMRDIYLIEIKTDSQFNYHIEIKKKNTNFQMKGVLLNLLFYPSANPSLLIASQFNYPGLRAFKIEDWSLMEIKDLIRIKDYHSFAGISEKNGVIYTASLTGAAARIEFV